MEIFSVYHCLYIIENSKIGMDIILSFVEIVQCFFWVGGGGGGGGQKKIFGGQFRDF
jgi:hypothetical protein